MPSADTGKTSFRAHIFASSAPTSLLSFPSVAASPTIMSDLRPRVSATFRRLGSDTNPIDPRAFERLWERNAPDRAVYAHARARWERDLAEAQTWWATPGSTYS